MSGSLDLYDQLGVINTDPDITIWLGSDNNGITSNGRNIALGFHDFHLCHVFQFISHLILVGKWNWSCRAHRKWFSPFFERDQLEDGKKLEKCKKRRF